MFSNLFFVTTTNMRTVAILANFDDAVDRAKHYLNYNPSWGSCYVVTINCNFGFPKYDSRVRKVSIDKDYNLHEEDYNISDNINVRINNRG